MKIKNMKLWKEWVKKNPNNTMGTSRGWQCIVYASRWAHLMEKAMRSGENLADVAANFAQVANK